MKSVCYFLISIMQKIDFYKVSKKTFNYTFYCKKYN